MTVVYPLLALLWGGGRRQAGGAQPLQGGRDCERSEARGGAAPRNREVTTDRDVSLLSFPLSKIHLIDGIKGSDI